MFPSNLEDVSLKKTLVAGTDPVTLDAYVAKAYWNLDASMPYPKMASAPKSWHAGLPEVARASGKSFLMHSRCLAGVKLDFTARCCDVDSLD
jgi:hypothetical protein